MQQVVNSVHSSSLFQLNHWVPPLLKVTNIFHLVSQCPQPHEKKLTLDYSAFVMIPHIIKDSISLQLKLICRLHNIVRQLCE